jgi:serine/threonine protein kinase
VIPGGAANLPTLVAVVDDDESLEFIDRIAKKNGVLYLAVASPPTVRDVHALEVRGPRGRNILSLLAEVMGPATEKGTPLRLSYPPKGSSPPSDKPTPHVVGDPSEQLASGSQAREKSDPFLGRALAGGKLLIEQCVGIGGAGTVYRARHRDLQMSVAVKLMHDVYQRDAKYCQRFHAEALSASRLDHANLTRVYDFGQEADGLLYIAMEFLDGRSLREVLEQDGAMPFDRAATIMAMVCSGLTHAHARSIVHRDIKPENIVLVTGLDDDGKETEIAKVCDFGIAHRTNDEHAQFAGTPEYISPEQFRGDDPDAQSDVYACGIVLYELLTGEVPIPGELPDIVQKVLDGHADPPSRKARGLDPRIDRLVMKSIALDREIRHASVRELRSEIRQLAEDIAVFTTGGGYYDNGPTSRNAPKIAESGGADWLEHGNGYLESLVSQSVPPPALSSRPPASAAGSLPVIPSSSQTPRAPMVTRQSSTTLRAQSIPPASGVPHVPLASIVPGSHVSMTPSMAPEASETARNVAAFVKRLVDTIDPVKFAALLAGIEPKIRMLFEQGYTGPAWRLCSALDMIARDKGPRAEHAYAALPAFSDREILTKLAEKSLDFMEDKEGTATKFVVRAGNRGAHALYSARLKHAVFEARERFVSMLVDIGVAGLPTIKAGLERLEPKLGVPGALGMAEDLLRAVPEVADDDTAHIVARYVKSNVNSLALLGTIALPRVAGLRARPLLAAQIHHKNDDVAIAAIKKLRVLGGVDAPLLEQLRPILVGAPGTRQPVKLAAAEALESSTPEALPHARALLGDALDAAQGMTPDVEDMVVMLANTIVSTGGDVTLVATRWRQSHTTLRTRLGAVLKRAKLPGH